MLVEREDLLGELVAGFDDALTGQGGLVFVGGEAGVGKSALVRALAAEVRPRAIVRFGGVDNVTTADAMGAFQDAVPDLVPILSAGGERVGVFRALRDLLSAEPGLLVLEDLHWADEATLDALRFLGRRLDDLTVLIVATYRHDEVTARHPLTGVLGDLAGQHGVRRMRVPPLSVDGVTALAAGTGLDPVAVHARTGGNAFFVTELLEAGGRDLPATVTDAILARVARLTPAAQDAAAAAATIGTVADGGLLAAIGATDVGAVDECVERGVLMTEGGGFAFRHELARQAVETSLSAVRRRQLHARAFRELTSRTPEDHRALAHHAAGSGNDAAAAHHATLAAERAARLGAHREAAAQYRIALRHGTAGADRAALFVALSYECYLTDQLPEAITARQRALELHELAGDQARAGDDQRWLSRLSWFSGRGADAERYASHAIAALEPLGPSVALAMAYSNLAQLRMLAKDDAAAQEWGGRALDLASRLGDVETESHALNNIGAAQIDAGALAEGEAALQRSLDLALSLDLHEHAARAYTNLASSAVEQRRYAVAETYLDAGIGYCVDRDLDAWTRYMSAWRCILFADLGRFDEALGDARKLLDSPALTPITAIGAAASAARVLSRRGEDAGPYLERAITLAATTGELQRVGTAACAAAEDAWLRGDTAAIPALTDAAWALAVEHQAPWLGGELAWWRSIAGRPGAREVSPAPAFALMLDRRPTAAAAAWDVIGSPVWASYARGMGDAAEADRAARELDRLGATRAVDALLRTRRDLGLPLPRRPRGAARQTAGNLTARELQVLALLAEGLSTQEIAGRLIVSPKTAEHHVSSVLRKLGEPTRARAVAAALRMHLLDDTAPEPV
jgi:DNA-binding CsgD family transcriptional regulator/tetratricopeptide (TPR) repeat protein